MREIWKDIKGFEGIYSVSNYGNVKRETTQRRNGTGNYARQEHILKQRINNKGYALVDLYKDNKRSQLLVHRLVAIAFLDNPFSYKVINHKDENPLNNKVENLEWCTQKYNMNYGTCPLKIGKANSKKVIQLGKSGSKIKEFPSIIEAERKTGISNGCIGEVLHGRRKTAGGYIWQYAK